PRSGRGAGRGVDRRTGPGCRDGKLGRDATLRLLLLGRLADVHYGNVEVQVLAGQRMVAVDAYRLVAGLDHRHQQRTALALGMELHARFDLVHALEQIARHVLDQRRIVRAVAFLRLDVDLQRVAGLLAGQCLLQARNDVAGTVEVAQRLRLGRFVDDLALVVGQGVVDAGDARVGDLHGSLLERAKGGGGIGQASAYPRCENSHHPTITKNGVRDNFDCAEAVQPVASARTVPSWLPPMTGTRRSRALSAAAD